MNEEDELLPETDLTQLYVDKEELMHFAGIGFKSGPKYKKGDKIKIKVPPPIKKEVPVDKDAMEMFEDEVMDVLCTRLMIGTHISFSGNSFSVQVTLTDTKSGKVVSVHTSMVPLKVELKMGY